MKTTNIGGSEVAHEEAQKPWEVKIQPRAFRGPDTCNLK